MNALAPQSMFRSAYRQITEPERSFVDRLVTMLADGARRHNQSIRLALQHPLPDALLALDNHGWLDRPLVQAAITEQILQRADSQEITADRWIREVVAIATFNMDDVVDYDDFGEPSIDLSRLSREQAAAIKSIDLEKSDGLTRSTKTRLKFQAHDKIAALKMWAAYLGLDDGENPHRRADRAAQEAVNITPDQTAHDAGEAYARLIGDD